MNLKTNSSHKQIVWSKEAQLVAQRAKSNPSRTLEQLVLDLQQISGNSKQQCWTYLIKNGYKQARSVDPWTDELLEQVLEMLTEHPTAEVARKFKRTSKSIRNVVSRLNRKIRDLRCDVHTVTSLAKLLHVRKEEVSVWIRDGWLAQNSVTVGNCTVKYITSDAFVRFWKTHKDDIQKRRRINYSYFDAFFQYCYSPKHTVGTQLLDVRADKKERRAFASASSHATANRALFDEDESAFEDDSESPSAA